MGSQRTFDYDYAARIMREHPDWPMPQVARAVTRYEREVRKDPGYGPIKANALASFKGRYQDSRLLLDEGGNPLPPLKGAATVRTQPWANVPAEFLGKAPLIYLRILHRIAQGEQEIPESRYTTSMNFGKQLMEHRQVVDLLASGRPYIRDARADELDGEGNLIAFSARFPGLSSKQWEALGTPEMRAVASAHWLTNYEAPEPASIMTRVSDPREAEALLHS